MKAALVAAAGSVLLVLCAVGALAVTAATGSAGCVRPSCPSGWTLPLPAGSYRLTSGFGPRDGTSHDGVDLAAPAGTAIYAVAGGVVDAAGCSSPFCDRPGTVDEHGRPTTPGCGLRVRISHEGKVATVYCHALALAVHAGQSVEAGQVVGWVGSTGHSTGPHLHLEIHRDAPPVNSTNAVDPVTFLAATGVAV